MTGNRAALGVGQDEPIQTPVQDDSLPKYVVEVNIEVRADDEEAARDAVDALLGRAWEEDSTAYDYEERPWHFEIFEDAVRRVEPRERG